MDKKTIRLGKKVMVSDPCYGLETWCQGVLENVKEGTYLTSFTREDTENRVIEISVVNEENINDTLEYTPEKFTIGVDSGQAGIFDYEYYKKYHSHTDERPHVDEDWYDRVCNLTDGFIKNENYIPFTQKDSYKAGIMGLYEELKKVKEQYPEVDTQTVYMGIINHYEDLNKPVSKSDLSMDGLLETLRELNKILDKDYVAPEKTEAEKALDSAKFKWEFILHDAWNEYKGKTESWREVYAGMADTIGNCGFVSSSGWGDGSYTCYTARDNEGRIIAIKVSFLWEEDEEE